MDRDIRFRGVSIFKPEWWEGFYIYSRYEDKHFIVQNAIDNKEPNGSISFAHFAEIDFSTLGQFTGLKDKNGTDIYEGDILDYTVFDFNDNDTQFKGVVNWVGSVFIVTQIPDSRCNGEYGIELYWVVNQDEEIEIIGNIHQTPELLKQK